MEEDEERWAELIVRFVRENIDEVADALEFAYATSYPHSKTNAIDAAITRRWTITCVEDLLGALKSADPGQLTYKNVFGDSVVDLTDYELSQFASFISCMKHYARTLAPLLCSIAMLNGLGALETQRLLQFFESFIQKLIVHSCELYAQSAAVPGSLYRTWNLTVNVGPGISGLRDLSGDETLASRYLGSDQLFGEHADDDSVGPISGEALTRRQRQVLDLLRRGKSNAEIAQELGVSQSTAKNHVSRLFDKYNVNSRAELLAQFVAEGARPLFQ